jgi:hypothetical protein
MKYTVHLTLMFFEGVIGETFVHKSFPYPSSLPALFLNTELISLIEKRGKFTFPL